MFSSFLGTPIEMTTFPAAGTYQTRNGSSLMGIPFLKSLKTWLKILVKPQLFFRVLVPLAVVIICQAVLGLMHILEPCSPWGWSHVTTVLLYRFHRMPYIQRSMPLGGYTSVTMESNGAWHSAHAAALRWIRTCWESVCYHAGSGSHMSMSPKLLFYLHREYYALVVELFSGLLLQTLYGRNTIFSTLCFQWT